MQKINGRVTGWGAYTPSRVLTNDDLSTFLDTNDEWIVRRTGIRERHIAADHETTCTMAVESSTSALTDTSASPSSSCCSPGSGRATTRRMRLVLRASDSIVS